MNQQPIFSERENDVISLLLMCKSNKQIAQALGISTRTVEFHLGNIYSKLQVSSRSEAIMRLSSNQLRESTGGIMGDELRENTVECKEEPSHNRGKPIISKWRPSMKTRLYLGTGLFAVILLITLYTLSGHKEEPILEQSSTTASQTNLLINDTHTPEIATPIPSPTLTAREQILAKAYSLAANYDQAVNSELQKGEVTVGTDPQSGQEVIRFEGNSLETISKLFDEFNQELQALNNEYKLLYIAEIQPTPFPTKPSADENDKYYQQLVEQYPAFFEQLLEEGPTVRAYDPAEGIYFNRLIGDAYAKSEIMSSALETLRLAPLMVKVNQEVDVNLIRQVVDNLDLQLTFNGIQNLANAPWIDAAIYTDDVGTTYRVAVEDGRLAQIEPSFAPEVPAIDVKSIDDVRPIAEQFAQDNSPRYTQFKSELVYEEGSKGDIYFFRWDYRNKDWTGTNWMMMPPFLQIDIRMQLVLKKIFGMSFL